MIIIMLPNGSAINKIKCKFYSHIFFQTAERHRDKKDIRYFQYHQFTYLNLSLGTPMGFFQTATTVATPAHQLLRALKRPSRSSTTLNGPTLAWAWGTETMASFSTVRSLQTLQGTKVTETTRVQLRLGWTTTTPTQCPQMKLTRASMWRQRTSRAWMRTPPPWETIQT